MFFCISLLEPCVCLAPRPQRSTKEKKRQGHDKYSVLKGCELAQALGMAQCMVGWQCPGASRQRLLGAKPASQWGHRGRRVGDQIRSRGENWDRFSCRCWDNSRTNDVIVWAFGGQSSGGGAQMGRGGGLRDHRVAEFEFQRQKSWHMQTWKLDRKSVISATNLPSLCIPPRGH